MFFYIHIFNYSSALAIIYIIQHILYFMPSIIKASGQREQFKQSKLRKSLHRSGATSVQAEEIVTVISQGLREGENTSDIYNRAFHLLRKNRNEIPAARYSLKQAIRELGPTGFPFEKFVGKIFEASGYDVKVGQIMKGTCVSHEMDVVAVKGKEIVLVEAKFRNRSGDDIGVRVPLYMRSRFEDILNNVPKEKRRGYRCMIVTNTRFSVDACKYADCVGNIKLIGWRFPKDNGLEHMIESLGLHPITVLNILSREEKLKFFEKGLVVCQDIDKAPHKLDSLGLSKNKINTVIEQAKELCRLKV